MRTKHGEEAKYAGPSRPLRAGWWGRRASQHLVGHQSGHLSHHRSKPCLLAMRPVFLKSQKPNIASWRVGWPAGGCLPLSLLRLPPSSLNHPSSNAATDSYRVGPPFGSQRASLRGLRSCSLQDPHDSAVSLANPHHSRCPPASLMVPPLACFVATEPVTLYAMLLL